MSTLDDITEAGTALDAARHGLQLVTQSLPDSATQTSCDPAATPADSSTLDSAGPDSAAEAAERLRTFSAPNVTELAIGGRLRIEQASR